MTAVQGVGALVTTPLLLHALGVRGYGAYALIVALPGLLPFVDFGLGRALTARVAKADGGGAAGSAAIEIGAAFRLLSLVAVVGLVGVGLATALVDWRAALGLHDLGHLQTQLSVFLVGAAIFVAAPFSLSMHVLVGLKRTHVATLVPGIATIVTSFALIVTLALAGAPLWAFVASQAFAYVVGPLCCFVHLRTRHRSVVRTDRRPSALQVKRALAVGLPFAGITVATAAAYETDLLVVSHVLGGVDVTSFAITLKYFNLAYPGIVAAGVALWPVFAGSLREGGDRSALRRPLRRWSFVFGFGGLAAAGALGLLGPWFIDLWTGGEVRPAAGLLAARGAFLFVSAMHYPAAMAVLALGRHRFQATTLVAMATANLPLSILLAHRFGVAGPVWASVVTFGVLHALPQLVVAFRETASP